MRQVSEVNRLFPKLLTGERRCLIADRGGWSPGGRHLIFMYGLLGGLTTNDTSKSPQHQVPLHSTKELCP